MLGAVIADLPPKRKIMKLAEGLAEKKDIQNRIADLHTRFTNAAVIEEGSVPDEKAAELLLSLEGAMSRMEMMTVALNMTNNTVTIVVDNAHLTMMQAIARRDNLKMQISQYDNMVNSIRHRNQNRRHYGENTPKMVLAEGVDLSYFVKKKDALSKELRVLDASIQAANWTNDLLL